MRFENRKTVLGVHAPPPRPMRRGFLALALLLSLPVALASCAGAFLG